MESIIVDRGIRSELMKKKYAFISADEFSFAPELKVDQQRLGTDWDNLEPDNYLKGNASFRLRRFGYLYFLPNTEEVLPFPPMPYFQSSEINAYAGDIQRTFAPLLGSTLKNKFLHELIKFNFRQFPVSVKKADEPWKLDIHQMRIVATPDEMGEPTPEGIHHDENDFGCIHLINRQNVAGGVSTIYDNNRNPLESQTLHQRMDSMIIWDPRIMHGVSPIYPKNPVKQAIRDTLLFGYSYDPELERPNWTTKGHTDAWKATEPELT